MSLGVSEGVKIKNDVDTILIEEVNIHMQKGSNLEKNAEIFLRELFEKMGFITTEVRRQKSGTQNGFDILVEFLDDDDLEKKFYFECKDYTKPVEWKEFLDKILQLDASSHKIDCFIALSPKSSISNVNKNTLEKLERKMRFPISLWSPDSKINEFFALNKDIYRGIYDTDCDLVIDENKTISTIKTIINHLIQKAIFLKITNKIIIKNAERDPVEGEHLINNLDEKLDAILEKNDPERIEFHKHRFDYKVFL